MRELVSDAHLLAGDEGKAGHEHVQPGARRGGSPPRAGIGVALAASAVAAPASAAAAAVASTSAAVAAATCQRSNSARKLFQ